MSSADRSNKHMFEEGQPRISSLILCFTTLGAIRCVQMRRCRAFCHGIVEKKEHMMKRSAVLFRSTPGARPNPVKGGYTALAIFLPLIVLTMLAQVAFGGQVMFVALLTAFGYVRTSSPMQPKILLA